MSDHCGTTTEEGNAVCVPGACSCSSETQNNAPKQLIPVLSDASEEKSHVEENS
jgi:hypothetical protein